jgi:hypothetical protein
MLNNQNTNLQTYGFYQISVVVDKIPGFAFQMDIEGFPRTSSVAAPPLL